MLTDAESRAIRDELTLDPAVVGYSTGLAETHLPPLDTRAPDDPGRATDLGVPNDRGGTSGWPRVLADELNAVQQATVTRTSMTTREFETLIHEDDATNVIMDERRWSALRNYTGVSASGFGGGKIIDLTDGNATRAIRRLLLPASQALWDAYKTCDGSRVETVLGFGRKVTTQDVTIAWRGGLTTP